MLYIWYNLYCHEGGTECSKPIYKLYPRTLKSIWRFRSLRRFNSIRHVRTRKLLGAAVVALAAASAAAPERTDFEHAAHVSGAAGSPNQSQLTRGVLPDRIYII